MKRIIIFMLLALLTLTGCSKTITCGECGKTKKGKTYTVEVFGESAKEDICDDCIDTVKEFAELLGGKVK